MLRKFWCWLGFHDDVFLHYEKYKTKGLLGICNIEHIVVTACVHCKRQRSK